MDDVDILLYEDGENTKIGGLLKNNCIQGSKIRFTSGAGTIFSKIKDGIKFNKNYLVFIDVVPFNKDTVTTFERCIFKSKSIKLKYNSSSNIVFVPIYGLEFVLLNIILDYSLCDLKNYEKYIRNPILAFKECKSRHCSLEEFYKYILNNVGNGKEFTNTKFGKWGNIFGLS